MKVHLIRKETITAYVRYNVQSKARFEAWIAKLKYADWQLPKDMQRTFPSTDLLGNGSNRVVFDIGGNSYRMIAKLLSAKVKCTFLFVG